MKSKLANILIVVIVAFLIFSVTLGLLLSYVNFNPMYYQIKTDNVSCRLQNWDIMDSKNENDLIRQENSLLNGETFQQLKSSQKKRENNLIIRNLTRFDVKFLKNCEDILSRNASLNSINEFQSSQKATPTFKDFADLQNKLNNKSLKPNLNVDIDWEKLISGLEENHKINLQKELVNFYNIIDYFYRKKAKIADTDILKFLFTIVRVKNLEKNVVALTVANVAEIWQYMIISNRFSDYISIQIGFETGFWSTENVATVIVHEYAHALENFLNSIPLLRKNFNSNKFPCEDKILNQANVNWSYYQKMCSDKTNPYILNKNSLQFSNTRIKTASDWLVEWLAKQAGVTEIMQKRLFAWSVVRSNYGRTSSFRELFAEAFTQWLLTKPDERTVKWELLNKFFSEKLPQFNPIEKN